MDRPQWLLASTSLVEDSTPTLDGGLIMSLRNEHRLRRFPVEIRGGHRRTRTSGCRRRRNAAIGVCGRSAPTAAIETDVTLHGEAQRINGKAQRMTTEDRKDRLIVFRLVLDGTMQKSLDELWKDWPVDGGSVRTLVQRSTKIWLFKTLTSPFLALVNC